MDFVNGSLLILPFKNNSFDLILCWGIFHHTVDPYNALKELIRVLKKDGYLILAVYQKTNLSFLHEMVRKVCLRIKWEIIRKVFIKSMAVFVAFLEFLGMKNNLRSDNVKIESQVEDWFFVPIKHFFSIEELKEMFYKQNLTFEVLCMQAGRLKSSSNVIVRGKKIGDG